MIRSMGCDLTDRNHNVSSSSSIVFRTLFVSLFVYFFLIDQNQKKSNEKIIQQQQSKWHLKLRDFNV